MSSPVFTALVRESQDCLRGNHQRIAHCVRQLNDEQIWWRPHESMNSIGNLILHLSGNIRQWIIAGVGDADDNRDRPKEFAERGPLPLDQLMSQLTETVDEACETLGGLDKEAIVQPRRIQGFELDGVGAIFDAVPHFKGHTQEIICLTRMQLGDGYQFHWQPSTPEEGAPS